MLCLIGASGVATGSLPAVGRGQFFSLPPMFGRLASKVSGKLDDGIPFIKSFNVFVESFLLSWKAFPEGLSPSDLDSSYTVTSSK
jgi:hypothetical protein